LAENRVLGSSHACGEKNIVSNQTDFSFASRKEQNPLHETLANPLITFAALFVSLALAEDFKTTNAKEYKNATVTLVEPDGITLRSKSGVSKVYFNKLPKEVQERFHYDPQKAAAASAEQAVSIQQANQQVEESNKQRKEAEQQKVLQNRVSEVQQQDEG